MAEGDYGIELPVTISGTTMSASDTLKFLEKEYAGNAQNTVNLVLTETESEMFTPKNYVYRLDWYQSGSFMCNVIPESIFKVVDKA